jgi:acetyl esterase
MPNRSERTKPMHAPVTVPIGGVGMPQRMRADEPDRDARAFLRCFNPFVRPVRHYSLAQLRRRWRLLAIALGAGQPVARVTRRVIDGPAGPIRLKVFDPQPSGAARPALLWCHGGGFLIGDTDCADAMCRGMARASGCVVVATSYRLAPEHDLRAGREDALAALQWLARHGASIGVDPSRLAIGGDSAGGNIAAAVAQHCLQRGPALSSQVLVYPATNLQSDYPSKAENAHGYLLTAEVMDWMKARITGSTDLGDPWISPGRNAKLGGLPAALILTAGYDPVRDDGLDYAARLRAAGVPVELLHYSGQFHGFLNFDAVIGAARDAFERIGGSLHRALRGGGQSLDRTLEIADATTDTAVSMTEAVGELASVSLVLWESVGRWSVTLLGLLSPAAVASSRLLLRPWLAVGGWARRRVGERLDRLAARETYPARGV